MPNETPTAETTVVDELPKELSLIVQQNALQPATANNLQESFAPIFQEARAVLEKSRGIVVTDASQTLDMKVARQYRLALKEIRVRSDKRRKELKDESLRTGRAIDAFHNILLHLTETEEKRLQDQEDFVARKEAERKAALTQQRTEILAGLQVDPNLYALGEMSEETFQTLLEGTKLARAAEAERRRREEAERIEREQKEQAERERIREENARLKREAEEKAEAEKREKARRWDLHCTRMAILGADKLLDAGEVTDADRAVLYGTQTEEEFVEILARLMERSNERRRLEAERIESARKLREAEEAAAAERARVEKERKAADEKARQEREAAEKKASEERAAREKAEQELRDQYAAEARRIKAEKEAARKAAAAPDKQKIVALAKSLDGVSIPDMATQEGKAVIAQFMARQHDLIGWLREEYKKL